VRGGVVPAHGDGAPAGIPGCDSSRGTTATRRSACTLTGAWFVADATRSRRIPPTPHVLFGRRLNAHPAFQERPLLTLDEVSVPKPVATSRLAHAVQTTKRSNESSKLAGIGLSYGRVAFPVTNEFLYLGRRERHHDHQRKPDQRVRDPLPHRDAVDSSCLNDSDPGMQTRSAFSSRHTLEDDRCTAQASSVGQFLPLGLHRDDSPDVRGAWAADRVLLQRDPAEPVARRIRLMPT